MSAITNALTTVIQWIYSIVQNHGWSIVLFTIFVRVILLPLDIKSRKGMRKMAAIQPQINALQKKYANDKQKLQQKQSELMRKERYNPLSGCLPLLIQMPILFAMFAAMRNIANDQIVSQVFTFLTGNTPHYEGWLWVKNVWMPDTLFAAVAPDANSIKMIGAEVWQKVFSQLNPDQVSLILQNIKTHAPEFAGVLDFSNAQALKDCLPAILTSMQAMPSYVAQLQPLTGWANVNMLLFSVTVYQQYNGFLILPVLAGASQFLMTKLTPQTQTAPAADSNNPNPNAFMNYFFPLFSLYICLTSNAGFAIYWVTTNLIASLQNYLITLYFDRLDKQAKGISAEVSVK